MTTATQDFKFMKQEYFGEQIIYVDLGALLKKTKDFTKVLKVMEECSSVDEILQYFARYDCSAYWNGQFLIGDRFRDD